MPGSVERSQEQPALISWRQATYALGCAALAIGGLWLQSHLHEVETMRQAILSNQGVIIAHGEQLKTLVENSKEAKEWRREERAWRFRVEQNMDLLMQELGASKAKRPGFSRDSQTNGTRRGPQWDH